MSGLKMLEDAFAEPREQRRALNLAAEGRLTVWVKKWRVALPVPEDAEAAWEQLERKLGLEPTPNATTAFASSLPAPDGHKTWLLVPPNACEELASKGTAKVRELPCADDPEQLAVFSEPLALTIADLWIDPGEAEKLLAESRFAAKPHPSRKSPHHAIILSAYKNLKDKRERQPSARDVWRELESNLSSYDPKHRTIEEVEPEFFDWYDTKGNPHTFKRTSLDPLLSRKRHDF